MILNKKVFFKTAIVFAGSVGLVIILHYFSIWNRGYVGGGFTRNFIDAPLISSTSMDLRYNSFFVAGLTEDKIYLGNYIAPLTIMIIDKGLKKPLIGRIDLEPHVDLPRGSVKLKIDSAFYYVMSGEVPMIYMGKTWISKARGLTSDDLYFKDAIPIGSETFVLKSESAKTHRDILIKKSKDSIIIDTTMLERQIDGVFCTDGMLHYSKSMSSLVYVYFYRNQYILADTNLQDIKRFNTIDTTSRAKLVISTVESEGIRTLAAPPVVANKKSYVSGDWLYIQSGLLADHEAPDDLKNYAVMDVYHLPTHQYRFSFYLPFEKRQSLTSFSVFGHTIVALYGRYLFSYEMSPSAFIN
jgi:hypothetical protein